MLASSCAPWRSLGRSRSAIPASHHAGTPANSVAARPTRITIVRIRAMRASTSAVGRATWMCRGSIVHVPVGRLARVGAPAPALLVHRVAVLLGGPPRHVLAVAALRSSVAAADRPEAPCGARRARAGWPATPCRCCRAGRPPSAFRPGTAARRRTAERPRTSPRAPRRGRIARRGRRGRGTRRAPRRRRRRGARRSPPAAAPAPARSGSRGRPPRACPCGEVPQPIFGSSEASRQPTATKRSRA